MEATKLKQLGTLALAAVASTSGLVLLGAGTASAAAPSADLNIVKYASPPWVQEGAPSVWVIEVTNNGPDTSSGWLVTDTLPEGFEAGTRTEGCTITGSELSCPGGQLAVGERAVITVSVSTRGHAPGDVVNTATVRGNDPDPNPGNNTASGTLVVVEAPLISAGVGLGALGLFGAGAGLRFRRRRRANA